MRVLLVTTITSHNLRFLTQCFYFPPHSFSKFYILSHQITVWNFSDRFDSIYSDDIGAYNLIKTSFWENGVPDVEIYFRRNTIEGGWIWIVASAVSFIDVPVPGMIIREQVAKDIENAKIINKITRITALLLTTIQASFEWKKKHVDLANTDASSSEKDGPEDTAPGVVNDIQALHALLTNEVGNVSKEDVAQLQQLIKLAAERDSSGNDNGGTSSKQDGSKSNNSDESQAENASGVGLDLSKIDINQSDVKLVTLILTGYLTIEDFSPLVINALRLGKTMEHALSSFQTEREWQQVADKLAASSTVKSEKSHRRGESASQRFSLSKLGNHLQKRSTLTQSIQHRSSKKMPNMIQQKLPPRTPLTTPPPISSLILSFSEIGNQGFEVLCEVFSSGSPFLRKLDISFCNIEERGFLAFARAIRKRKREKLPDLRGLVLSGNKISYKAAKELGLALSSTPEKKRLFRKRRTIRGSGNGYDEDDEEEEDDFDIHDDDDVLFGAGESKSERKNVDKSNKASQASISTNPEDGLSFLHLDCTSLSSDALNELLVGLGQDCPLQELSISSNNIGASGASTLVKFLEGKGIRKFNKKQPVMPRLDRINLSNNNLGNDGAAKLTRGIAKRVNQKINIVEVKLSSNGIGALGIETIMNKLLQHNLKSLSLDNNLISDRGCQLVAASLPSMHHIERLNLCFNQIGSRGITALMRAVVGCESITSLSISGNVLKVSGAIAMGFALAQHPRLAELELENCCLSQVSQCHIVAGIISNRWVPMKDIVGFRVGPPMAAIGGLDAIAHHLSNEECFRIRREIQLKNILQWMGTARAAQVQQSETSDQFLTSDYASSFGDAKGVPSQSAYLRMLEWLSRIPFDEDELNDLRKYFFDADGGDSGDGMRGSDGQINLKHRGDLLAALGSNIVQEIRDNEPLIDMANNGSKRTGLNIDDLIVEDKHFVSEVWGTIERLNKIHLCPLSPCSEGDSNDDEDCYLTSKKKRRKASLDVIHDESELTFAESNSNDVELVPTKSDENMNVKMSSMKSAGRSISSLSQKSSVSGAESVMSTESRGQKKARISMFPPFAAKLELLKSQAQQLMDIEQDPYQQDVIAQQFAEASLTLLRQLRYHCMNNGLDGWRQGKLRRKVLIVDDSIVTRKLVSRAFEKANFIVDTAANGEEGVEKLKLAIYDIAFMDIDMPVMNGFDATKALRDWEDVKRPGARQPICALTAAYVDDFERSELMKFKNAGLDVMESKPCNIPRLFKVVDDVSPMFSDLSINVTQVGGQ